ncbi:hypothetical protein [Parabacteroides gordonii]|uniref:AraC-type arabinose-binding/dimerisation domain-containing protein n=1 Tax=Parabacteroides gordonii MS-1 = DSM 23371 TaxID=1203610 RepID=A0A0F5JS76_9BACT|nr:hypothetical protein [Parabacteroides gordonii]KKB60480.1 hypothetical protein HMPREF1536_00360 [Parabacteroides gordonii MS-1 = DSM 23371]MCA5584433.1 hypothetical protein [Parabacteroides gordonii]RGP15160.1 hypothetical protein DXB27_14810 [Parabacteroides gordonii]
MKNFFNQFECKEVKAKEVAYDTESIGNVLLFVTVGKLLISSTTSTPAIELNEGHFVLLPAENRYFITAVTDAKTVLMHAGSLSAMITEDPEWNPERPVILPIFPSLAKTIYLLESYQKEAKTKLN